MAEKLSSTISVIGIDIGKNSFHVVGLDERGAIVLRQKGSRGQVETRFANMPSCLIGMEACVGAHPPRPRVGARSEKRARPPRPPRPRRTTVSPAASTPCTWKTFFARSKPIVLASLMDGSRPLVSLTTQTLAHRCREGAIHPIRLGPFMMSAQCPDCRRKQTPARHPRRSQKCRFCCRSRLPPALNGDSVVLVRISGGGVDEGGALSGPGAVLLFVLSQ